MEIHLNYPGTVEAKRRLPIGREYVATSMDKGVKAAIIQGLIVKLSFVTLYDYS